MADPSLTVFRVCGLRIDASASLATYSVSLYLLYVINQGTYAGSIAVQTAVKSAFMMRRSNDGRM